jgi:hypothetical protein
MEITLNNLIEYPNEPFYSQITTRYGENKPFSPIKIIDEIEGVTINSAFHWIEWLNWNMQNVDFVKWNALSSKYVNINIDECDDLEILYWLMLNNPEIQNKNNFKHYINLFENSEIDFLQKPFDLWAFIPKLQDKYWSRYFLNRNYIISENKDYPSSLLADYIPRLKPEIKQDWIDKFFKMDHSSKDVMELIIWDDSFYSSKYLDYFRELNPPPAQIGRLILQKARKDSVFLYYDERTKKYWFQYFLDKKGSLFLIIYTMHKVLEKVVNHNYNLLFWIDFLHFINPDLKSIENQIKQNNNITLKGKWAKVKAELFKDGLGIFEI